MSAAVTQLTQEITRRTEMRVRKRNGALEPVDVNKIVRAVGRCCRDLTQVDSLRIATKTIGGLYRCSCGPGRRTRSFDRIGGTERGGRLTFVTTASVRRSSSLCTSGSPRLCGESALQCLATSTSPQRHRDAEAHREVFRCATRCRSTIG